MPQLAYNLNQRGLFTKKGNKWKVSTVRNILTNKLYIGEYNVAGVLDQVEEYRILSDSLFKKASNLRVRYRTGKHKRPAMPVDRRKKTIRTVFNEYMNFLETIDGGTTQ